MEPILKVENLTKVFSRAGQEDFTAVNSIRFDLIPGECLGIIVEVGTQVSGIIDKIYVDYNSVVTKGQLIAEMDRVTLQSELASQRAAYDGAKAEYEYQKKLYERNKTLHEKQLIATKFIIP